MKAYNEYDNNKWMIASLILMTIAVGILCFTIGYNYASKNNKVVIFGNGLEMKQSDMESLASVFYNSTGKYFYLDNLETNKRYIIQK